MVKNKAGGNKSKKMGRKFSVPQVDRNIRQSESEEEIYASVIKLLGNGMFHAIDTDQKERLCIMRQKFKGRGKRDNTVAVGSWVLIGIRIWEGGACSKPKCDLLEVYNDVEKAKLKKSGDSIFSKLRNDSDYIAGATIDTDGGGGFEFNDHDECAVEEYKNMIKDIMNKKKSDDCSTSLEKVSADDNDIVETFSGSIIRHDGDKDKDKEDDTEGDKEKYKKKRKGNTKNKNTIIVPSSIGTIGISDNTLSHQEIDIDDI